MADEAVVGMQRRQVVFWVTFGPIGAVRAALAVATAGEQAHREVAVASLAPSRA